MSGMRAALSVFVATVSLALALAPVVEADPIQATYSTTGTIGTTGITGPPDVSFQGVSDGTLTTGQPFSLGQFVVTTPSGGGTTTYSWTPFQIEFTVTGSSGDPSLPKATPVTLSGVLETEDGSGQTLVRAYFLSTNPTVGIGTAPPQAFAFWTTQGGSIAYSLYPTSTAVILDPTGQNGNAFPAQAQLDAYSAPEPSALATFVAAAIALVMRSRFGRSQRLVRPDRAGTLPDGANPPRAEVGTPSLAAAPQCHSPSLFPEPTLIKAGLRHAA